MDLAVCRTTPTCVERSSTVKQCDPRLLLMISRVTLMHLSERSVARITSAGIGRCTRTQDGSFPDEFRCVRRRSVLQGRFLSKDLL